ncbi:pentapeptide repeat-containing protein [Actinomadura sp. 3N508]|uniref:pentapeptide repeat-containing protein n=1 Tax=Actinomadura sp. 3N508 TaxID=3375153 RepID=UPI0037B35414
MTERDASLPSPPDQALDSEDAARPAPEPVAPLPQVSVPAPAELDALPADRRLELLELQQERLDRRRDRLDAARERRRQSLHQWINSGVLLIGAMLAGGSLLATAATLRTGQDELHTTKEGQVTDRYTKATELLASSKREVRTAAIYALERIAADSHRDRLTIRDVLAAYVREHDPAPTIKSADLPKEPETDVAAALTVLTRHSSVLHSTPSPAHVFLPLDLHQARISGAQFPHRANLSRANLSRANLSKANMARADLTGAELYNADLTGALVYDADLTGALLYDADLTGALLSDADLTNATLYSADLSGADLTGADLSGADLSGADLTGADLSGADLSGADLTNTTLDGADLSGADLTGVEGVTEAEIRSHAMVDRKTTFG